MVQRTEVTAEVDWLKRVSIFSELDAQSLEGLRPLFKEQSFAKDEVIVGQETRGDSLYILSKGKVKVVLFGASGREVILSVFRPGDFFGEMSLLDNEPRSANVVAVEASRLFVLDRSAFARHLHSNPRLALNVLAEMSRRLRRADEVIGNLALLDVYGRVARYLREMASREGVETVRGIEIKHRPDQSEVAAMIGTTRETVSRAFSEFQRRGFIEIVGNRLILRQGFDTSGDRL
jgi:CRP/FNR family transcriptional regulator/CRP/FNR family cyclic AMP-dependent transcriptional regulator